MFTSAKFLAGWPVEQLEAFRSGRTISFRPGLNVLVGKNGSGKTALLRTLGAHAGCREHGGWSTLPNSFDTDHALRMPACLTSAARLGPAVRADVVWDGTAAFLHLAAVSDAPMIAFGMPHDTLSDSEQLQYGMGRASTGLNRAFRLSKVIQAAKNGPPDLTTLKPRPADKVGAKFVAYLKRRLRKGPATLLLDEPERSLDRTAETLLWSKIFPELSKTYQVIVASHSPFAVLCLDAHIIELTADWASTFRDELRRSLAAFDKEPPCST